MEHTPIRTVFGEITDFLATNPAPEAIIAYRLPEDLRKRAETLLERNSADLLSDDEQAELMDFVRVDQMMSLLKIKMRIKLQQTD